MKRQFFILSGIFLTALFSMNAEPGFDFDESEMFELEFASDLMLSSKGAAGQEKKQVSNIEFDLDDDALASLGSEAVNEEDEKLELKQAPDDHLLTVSPEIELDDSYELLTEAPKSSAATTPHKVKKTDEREAMVVRANKSAPNLQKVVTGAANQVSFAQVFAGSPIIYSILFTLSVFALGVSLYNIIGLRSASDNFVRKIRQKLMSNQFDEALSLCVKNDQLFGRIVGAGISARKYGLAQMLETMKAEGKRSTIGFWQRIALLNDIAIIAPMLGLLGTVLGMFYAFYDLNRSRESVNTLFDGLGISVGTTVAGLVVAIFAMMLHSLAKYKLVRTLAHVEDEAESLAALMEARMSTPIATDKPL